MKKRSYLDPRTKIVIMFMIAIFVLGGVGAERSKDIIIILSIIPYVMLALEKRWKHFIRGIFILFIGYLLLFLSEYLGKGIFGNIFLMSGVLITKFAPGITMGSYLMSSVTISEFVAAMQKIHISESITIPMAVMFRFFPTVIEELSHINEAMRIRGISLGKHNFLEVIEYRLVPTITCSVKIGDDLSAAALTRGLYSKNDRTNICCIGIRLVDVLVYIGCMAAIFIIFLR